MARSLGRLKGCAFQASGVFYLRNASLEYMGETSKGMLEELGHKGGLWMSIIAVVHCINLENHEDRGVSKET